MDMVTAYYLVFSDFPSICLKIASHVLGMIPLFSPYPTIEYDFPDPV